MNHTIDREELLLPILSHEVLDALNHCAFPKPVPNSARATHKVIAQIREFLATNTLRIDILQPSFRPRSCRTIQNEARAIAAAENITTNDEPTKEAFEEVLSTLCRIIGVRVKLSSLPGLEKLVAFIDAKLYVFKVEELETEKDADLKSFAKAINEILSQFGCKDSEQANARKCISDFLSMLCQKEVTLSLPRAPNAVRTPQKNPVGIEPKIITAEFDENTQLYDHGGETVALVRRHEANFTPLCKKYDGQDSPGIIAIAVIVSGKKTGRTFPVRKITQTDVKKRNVRESVTVKIPLKLNGKMRIPIE